jgi:glycosylphosphatidylinositol transamidase
MPLLSNLLSQDIPQNFYKFQLQIYSGLYLIGILGFLYLSSPIVSRRTYLSENALSPGLVSSDLFISADHIRHIMTELRTGFKNNNIADVIQSMLAENGIEAYKQDIGRNLTDQQEENIYGIVRAPRLASTESIILVAPLHVRLQGQPKPNLFGIAHALAIGSALHRKPYMAKDIILLFPAAQENGTRIWLDAYFNNNPHSLPLDAHAGSIQAGLALEFPHEKFYSIDLRHNGINGQLPNLDLINTIVQLCDKNSMATSLYNIYVDLSTNEAYMDYIIKSTRTLLLNVLTLATGVSDGVHGQFLHYRIEMITLFGSLDKHNQYQNSPITSRALDDVIEGEISCFITFEFELFLFI